MRGLNTSKKMTEAEKRTADETCVCQSGRDNTRGFAAHVFREF